MVILTDLEGAHTPETQALYINKASDLDVCFLNSLAATAAGSMGSLNVWMDVDDNIRCESHSYGKTMATATFIRRDNAKRWVSRYLKIINGLTSDEDAPQESATTSPQRVERRVLCRKYLGYQKGYELKYTIEGYFHTWGQEFKEFESGPGNSTVAVIEHLDGTIDTYPPNCIKFVH